MTTDLEIRLRTELKPEQFVAPLYVGLRDVREWDLLPRVKIEHRQPVVHIVASESGTFTGCNMFDRPTGGELILRWDWDLGPVNAVRGQEFILTMNWSRLDERR